MAYVPPHRRQNVSPEKQPFFDPPVHCTICCINLRRRPDKWQRLETAASRVSDAFLENIRRFDAIDGHEILSKGMLPDAQVSLDWDSTINARYSPKVTPGLRNVTAGEIGCALSHIALWRQLVEQNGEDHCMLILEDDVEFTSHRGTSRFRAAFKNAWEQLPSGWGLLYLGFSSRGERIVLEQQNDNNGRDRMNPKVELYKPEYGYHTHAYVITKSAASVLLSHLPVRGPLDVWLSDNQWFDIPVYCAVISGEGWRREDGTYEGAVLVRQSRGSGMTSDVPQSSGDKSGSSAAVTCHSMEDT